MKRIHQSSQVNSHKCNAKYMGPASTLIVIAAVTFFTHLAFASDPLVGMDATLPAPSSWKGQPGLEVLSEAGADWTVQFTIKDYLEEYVFPEQLISYELKFPPRTVRAENLRLTAEQDGQVIPYQLGTVQTDGAFLRSAAIRFRTDLPLGGERQFVLTNDSTYRADFIDQALLRDRDAARHTAVLDAGTQQVLVPYGSWKPARAMREVPAPILKLSRGNMNWVAAGRLEGNILVKEIHTDILEDGPLMLAYRIRYHLSEDKRYTVVLTIRAGDDYVTVDEYFEGIRLEDQLAFRLSYSDGINPDARIAMANNGDYLERSGPYDKGLRDGQFPFSLGIFGPNVGCPRSVLLYRDDDPASDAIAFSLYRLHDWKTHIRHTWWTASQGEGNLRFSHRDSEKYMKIRLIGAERHWAVSILSRRQVAIQSQDGSRDCYWYANAEMKGWDNRMRGGDPAARLFQRLGAYSLDWVKDLVFDWDEDVDVVYDHYDEPLTYHEFNHRGKPGTQWNGMFWWGGVDWDHRWIPIERYQDGMCYGAKNPGRSHWQLLGAYAASRKNWTLQERQKVRAWIIHFVSTYMFLDDNLPSESMLAGHPNFLIESIYPGVFAAIFPKHPYVEAMRREYDKLLDEYLHVYLRKGNPSLQALPGRHTESIACYSFASMAGVLHNAKGFRQIDGTNILSDERFKAWIRWHLNALITAGEWDGWEFSHNDLALTPPEGAHAHGTSDVLDEMADYYIEVGDLLGDELKWALTKGIEGRKPELVSALFNDYGPILRYDVGGPHEAYLHMQLLGHADPIPGYRISGMNYRWRGEGNGVLYYAANGHTWSWNRREDNGDEFDIDQISAFAVDGQGLGWRKLDDTSRFMPLGPVQYFRTSEEPDSMYRSRGVLMVRDLYIAVHDDLGDDSVDGTFRWVNQLNGVKVVYFDNPDFTQETYREVRDERFPISFKVGTRYYKSWEHAKLSNVEDFSVRLTTRVRARWNDPTFRLHLGENDRATLYIDGQAVLTGGNGTTGKVTMQKDLEYDLRLDYIHTDGPSQLALGWCDSADPKGNPREFEGAYCTFYRDLPAIHGVHDGPGDELHLIEPRIEALLTADARPYGARIRAGEMVEYVILTDRSETFQEGQMQCTGRAGYATEGELYLLEGESLRLGELAVGIEGNFGISVRLAEGHIAGRVAGSEGGIVRITVPRAVTSLGAGATLRVDGQPAKFEYHAKSHTFRFNIAISRQDGFKTYSIQSRSRAADDDEAFPGLRDPHKWPFSENSIWNMPIGTGAKYKPQPIAPEHIDGIMVDLDIIIMTPDAPLMNVYGTDQLWGADVTPTRRCLEHDGIVHLRLPIPSEYITAAGYGSRPNNPAAILLADGRTVLQTQPFQVCNGGYATTGLRRSGSGILRYKDVDLFGDGTYGMHGGSGLSSLGGAIRVGELAPGSGPIRHALKISFPGKHYLYYDKENDIGYRWPARKHDSNARTNYTGTEPEAKIGCLRAISPTVDINDLGLETEPGRKIAWTLQNYGAYQVEGVPWARCMIAAEDGPDGCVPELFQQQWGYEIVTQNKTGNPWFRDMIKIFNQLCIITNNRPNSIGGGGTPRVPLVPPLSGMGIQPGPYSLKETTK